MKTTSKMKTTPKKKMTNNSETIKQKYSIPSSIFCSPRKKWGLLLANTFHRTVCLAAIFVLFEERCQNIRTKIWRFWKIFQKILYNLLLLAYCLEITFSYFVNVFVTLLKYCHIPRKFVLNIKGIILHYLPPSVAF